MKYREKNDFKKTKGRQGSVTYLDPEPRSFESSNRHLRIDVDFPSECEPLGAVALIIAIGECNITDKLSARARRGRK
jgi:hypothetical protein